MWIIHILKGKIFIILSFTANFLYPLQNSTMKSTYTPKSLFCRVMKKLLIIKLEKKKHTTYTLVLLYVHWMKNITKHQSIISSKYAHPTTRSESSVLYLLPVAPMRGLPLTSDSCLSQEHISNFKNKTRQETLRQAFGIVSHAYQSIFLFLK
jgi:hypothetical protein